MRRALIAGSAGQDGVYLARLLHRTGYAVAGIDQADRPGEVEQYYSANLTDRDTIRSIVSESRPDEVYFLAAFHQSAERTDIRDETLLIRSLDVNTIALCHMLSAIADLRPTARLLYASSSRVFGEPATPTQNEETPIDAFEPYAISKAAGMRICRYWRSRGLFAVSAILYNHESPLRSPQFISQKIIQFAIRASQGTGSQLRLGSLSSVMDWGHAADTVRAMWLILQQPQPEDYVVATGELHTVRDWLDEAFGLLSIEWRGSVVEDRSVVNRLLSGSLCGDSAKLRKKTGWRPEFTFQALVRDMVESELQRQNSRSSATTNFI
jgi:GDPmannose 4,6-dehydratase